VTLIGELADKFRVKNVGKRLVAWMVTNCGTQSEREQIVEILKKKVQVRIFVNFV
jgi:hypothetical protein